MWLDFTNALNQLEDAPHYLALLQELLLDLILGVDVLGVTFLIVEGWLVILLIVVGDGLEACLVLLHLGFLDLLLKAVEAQPTLLLILDSEFTDHLDVLEASNDQNVEALILD